MIFLNFIADLNIVSILCLVIGLGLVVFEMFHPGFGAPGVGGVILLTLGIILTAKTLMDVLIMIIIILAVLAVALTIVLYSATKGRLSKTLVLSDYLRKENAHIGDDALSFFIDKEGITLTVLRPSGSADFDGVRLDVVSEGEFIQKDTKVKIIKVEGHRIVVRELK